MEEDLLYSLRGYLIEKYNCHSIILYGSYANGDYTEESDIDLICFCDNTEKENDTSVFKNRRLDVWIYNTEVMSNFTEFLHVKGGKVLLDKKNLCVGLLEGIDKEFIKGPKQLSLAEKEFLKNWLKKMFKRACKGDIEGNFRYHWMLTDALEIYFNVKGIWYLGPKKSLRWLYENDRKAYQTFDSALKVNASIEDVSELMEFIIAA